MGMKRILTIDDDDEVREVVRRFFEREGCTVFEARTGEKGLELLSGQEVDAVLLDLEMPGMGGIGTLEKIRSAYPYLPVVILTGFGQVRTAIEATRLGADDYLEKPAAQETVIYTVRKAIENRGMIREITHWRENNRRSRGITQLVFESAAMKTVVEAVRRVAPTDYTVLITGETGTGKDVVAMYLHDISRRADKIFIPVDCGAIPDNLIESELFGHERGAFTGADKRKEGVFELADGGTLFLDELANLSLPAHAKFLRVLQDRKVKRLGASHARDIDVRVIVATNADVEQAIADGRFREDLYFRLNEFRIQLPPLRERQEDLAVLAAHFTSEISKELGRTITLSHEALNEITGHAWPGNVRELKNVIRSAALYGGPTIKPEHLTFARRAPDHGKDGDGGITRSVERILESGTELKEIVREYERQVATEVISRLKGDKKEAARLLGLHYTTLLDKLR